MRQTLQLFFLGKIEIEISSTEKNDWFELHAEVKFGNFRIPFLKLKKNILQGNREFKLPDGSIAILPDEWFENYRDLLAFAENKDNQIQLKKQYYSLLENTNQTNISFQEKFRSLVNPESLQMIAVPEQLNAQLRPYQLTGFSWMHYLMNLNFGCCLADDMGLGKTIQTLCLLKKVQVKDYGNEKSNSENTAVQLNLFTIDQTDNRNTSLIVMPTSLIHNWVREIEKFVPGMRYHIHEGAYRAVDSNLFKYYDLILTPYGIVRNDIEIFRNFEFNYVILDESQYIKNPDSKVFKAVIQLNCNHRLSLTGTPIENSLNDLWSQMTFLNPGLLGDLNYFKSEFLVPIEKNGNEKRQLKLKKLIEPFILRRLKQQVAKDLPELSENIRFCEMTEDQAEYYERKKSKIRNLLLADIRNEGGISKQMIAVLKALMELRQIANHPVMDDIEYNGGSGKFDEVVSSIEEVISGNHKVLIFSSFVKHLKLFADYLNQKGIEFQMLTGSTPSANRQKIIEKFQNDVNSKIFLVSIKSGGFGLNLTAADYVFILDPWWNPAVELQAISRAHRIGQENHVFSYKFITKGTIEEKILVLQERKKLMAEMFINAANPLRSLSQDDVEELFN